MKRSHLRQVLDRQRPSRPRDAAPGAPVGRRARRLAGGRDQRPAFDRLLKDATRRRFDIIMAWSVDRLGRSLQDLVSFLGEVHAQGVDLYLDRQGVDTTTPGGKALFRMMAVFAEFERAIQGTAGDCSRPGCRR
jgi:hypothetical protein